MSRARGFAGAVVLALIAGSAGAECTLKRYELSAEGVSALQEIQGLASDFAELERLGHYTLALGGFRAVLEGPKDGTVPYQIYAEQWQIFGAAANGLSSHLRDQLKLVIDFQRLRAGLSADERAFWADLRGAITRKPIDPADFAQCGDAREAKRPEEKPEDTPDEKPEEQAGGSRGGVAGGGAEGGLSGAGGFGGDLFGPREGSIGGGDFTCSIWDGRACTLVDIK